MSLRRPISDTVKYEVFNRKKLATFVCTPSVSWGFPLNTEFRVTFILS